MKGSAPDITFNVLCIAALVRSSLCEISNYLVGLAFMTLHLSNTHITIIGNSQIVVVKSSPYTRDSPFGRPTHYIQPLR